MVSSAVMSSCVLGGLGLGPKLGLGNDQLQLGGQSTCSLIICSITVIQLYHPTAAPALGGIHTPFHTYLYYELHEMEGQVNPLPCHEGADDRHAWDCRAWYLCMYVCMHDVPEGCRDGHVCTVLYASRDYSASRFPRTISSPLAHYSILQSGCDY